MKYIIVGLGNPEEEYKNTRHNAGMIAVDYLAKSLEADWKKDSVKKADVAKADIAGDKITILKPLTFMNKSGFAVKDLKGKLKDISRMIVVHDDVDLPIGAMKIVFNRGSGGHKGVDSINSSIKSEAYIRIRIGVSPKTPSGKIKKPDHKKMLDFIVGDFKKEERQEINKISKKITEAISVIIKEGIQKGMTDFN